MIGIDFDQCFETILVLYHMAKVLQAKLEVIQVRLGTVGYNVQLKVTRPQGSDVFDPEVEGFAKGLSMLR